MKLRNKKTGEIVEFRYLQSDHVAPLVLTTYENDKPEMYSYNYLAELNEEWKDYEEPETFWYMTAWGDVKEYSQDQFAVEQKIAIGNYFESREEAEQAVEKLKAWKRLKDKGMRALSFKREKRGIDLDYYTVTILAPRDRDSLELLFGGEE